MSEIAIPFTNILLPREDYPILDSIGIESLIWWIIIIVLQCIVHNQLLTHSYTDEYEKVKNSTLKFEDTDKRFTKERIEKMPIISEEDDKWHAEHKAMAIAV